ncbi:hypothetical protein CcI6DRAFT_00328 [Frankia sp. CcI6]|nr:hypothetical protein CcI6DRAFT_00328 [Frankia sp. CcI6]
MQSPGPGPQDPDAQTQGVDGNAGGSYSASPYSAGSAPFGDEDETHLIGDSAPGVNQPGGYPPTAQYSQHQHPQHQHPQHQYAQNPYAQHQHPQHQHPQHQYPQHQHPQHQYAQNPYRGTDQYPPTAVHPPSGGYPPGEGYGQDYPVGGYPTESYPQQAYQQNYQPGYQQGYQQQGYPAADGYGGYPPPGAPPRPGGSQRRRNTIIAAAVAATLLLIVVSVALLSGGSDNPGTVAASESPSASPTSTSPSSSPSPSPSPSPSVSPSVSPSAQFTSAQHALLAKLDSSVMMDCEPNSEAEGGHIKASLFCNSDDGKVVAAYSYATTSDLNSDVEVRKSLVTTTGGKCEQGGDEVFTWNFHEGATQGTAVCNVRDGDHFIFWSYNSTLVSFMATGPDGAALYEWWSNFDPVPKA